MIKKIDLNRIIILILVIILIVIGHFLFAQFANYTYNSNRHIYDILRAKLWSIFLVLAWTMIIYWKRRSEIAPLLAVLAVSIYFVVIYSILFRGTQYGLNSHWGDNGYRLATVCKMMAYNDFPDAYLKNLPSMYPPLWFYIMAIYAKIAGLAAWQTLKYGYLFMFLSFPWVIYYSWRPLVSPRAAAMVSIATIFFAHNSIDYVGYEYIASALFVPWWLYFFEDGKNIASGKGFPWKFYITGIIVGGAIFLTYYYWFFIAVISLPLTVIIRHVDEKSGKALLNNLKHKAILASGIALVTAVYWVPLLLSGLKTGYESSQITWFGMTNSSLDVFWINKPLEGSFVLAGIFFAAYFWNRWNHAHLILYYAGALIFIMLDRISNLGNHSIQTRKILQFTHVITMGPLAVGLESIWNNVRANLNVQRGLVALAVILAIVFGNNQIENISPELYKNGVNDRYPKASLEYFKDAVCFNTVFLTNRYIETCYLPYFLFIPPSDVASHFAGDFQGRLDFLKAISKISKPSLLAYAMSYNIFDKINYVFLPYNGTTDTYIIKVNMKTFNGPLVLDSASIPASLFSDTASFKKIHPGGLYEVISPEQNPEIYEKLTEEYPDLIDYLKSKAKSR